MTTANHRAPSLHHLSPKNAAAGTKVVGYCSQLRWDHTWHADPACAGPSHHSIAIAEDTLAQVADRYAEDGYWPCAVCTLAATLDGAATRAPERGYYSLKCGDSHRGEGCNVCDSLHGYATGRNLPATTHAGRVAILVPGTRHARAALLAMGLAAHETGPEPAVANVTNPMWAGAAVMFYAGGVTLAAALEAASALHTPPVHT